MKCDIKYGTRPLRKLEEEEGQATLQTLLEDLHLIQWKTQA